MNPHEEHRLRDLLDDAVADVEPRPGLAAIRNRTKVHPMSNRPWLFAAGGAVLATAATIAAFTVLDNDAGTTSSEPRPAAGGTSHKAAPSQAVEPSPSPASPSDQASPGGSTTIPVYYVGQTGQGPRLYREFHRTSDAGKAIHDALTAAVGTAPDDPDYFSSWPAGTTVTSTMYVSDPAGISVNLGGDPQDSLADRPAGMSEEEARLAVQQLVYTATAAAHDDVPVQFLLFGKPTDTLLGVPTKQPVTRADSTRTLAQVWIIDPQEGATLPNGFTVNGVGAFFEANVIWELRQGDTVVKQGFTTAEECCTMAPYSFTVKAPPGDYTLVVRDEDASSGEGPPPFQDTKDITIR